MFRNADRASDANMRDHSLLDRLVGRRPTNVEQAHNVLGSQHQRQRFELVALHGLGNNSSAG
jgi:hypothetical protein